MSLPNSPLEIFKLLKKTNCRQCQVPTCLAFAAAVTNGQKSLGDCPHLESDIIEQFDIKANKRATLEEQQENLLERLRTTFIWRKASNKLLLL